MEYNNNLHPPIPPNWRPRFRQVGGSRLSPGQRSLEPTGPKSLVPRSTLLRSASRCGVGVCRERRVRNALKAGKVICRARAWANKGEIIDLLGIYSDLVGFYSDSMGCEWICIQKYPKIDGPGGDHRLYYSLKHDETVID